MKLSEQIVLEDVRTITAELGDGVDQLAGKKVIITGGAGFLGHYLILTLIYLNQTPRQ